MGPAPGRLPVISNHTTCLSEAEALMGVLGTVAQARDGRSGDTPSDLGKRRSIWDPSRTYFGPR